MCRKACAGAGPGLMGGGWGMLLPHSAPRPRIPIPIPNPNTLQVLVPDPGTGGGGGGRAVLLCLRAAPAHAPSYPPPNNRVFVKSYPSAPSPPTLPLPHPPNVTSFLRVEPL